MGALASKLEAEMKPGARLILVSKQVESEAFEPWGDGQEDTSRWNRRTRNGTSTVTSIEDVRGAAECVASFVREYYAWCYRYNTRVSTG